MKDYIKKLLIYIIVLIAFLSLIYFLKEKFKPGITQYVIHDTAIITKYEKELKRDTVVRWLEKINYKISEPEKILFQETDTEFVENAKNLDLMLQVRKENDNIVIKAIDQSGKIFKELTYNNIGNDFIATSTKNNIIIKSKKFYWNGLNTVTEVNYDLNDFQFKNHELRFGLNTGFNYLDKYNFVTGLYYSIYNKSLSTKFGINYKLIK